MQDERKIILHNHLEDKMKKLKFTITIEASGNESDQEIIHLRLCEAILAIRNDFTCQVGSEQLTQASEVAAQKNAMIH